MVMFWFWRRKHRAKQLEGALARPVAVTTQEGAGVELFEDVYFCCNMLWVKIVILSAKATRG